MHNLVTPSWNCGQATASARVSNWYEFIALLETDFLDWPEYIYRGQKNADWTLRSKFDREYRNSQQLLRETDLSRGLDEQDRSLVEQANPNLSLDSRSDLLARLLNQFKKACTGRRGLSPKNLTDTEWWALGQHFGLATPLLDWTRSPYVATYFALKEPDPRMSENRAVWAYTNDGLVEILENMPDNISKDWSELSLIEVVEGLIDENSRIVSQSGLFTKTPRGEDIEEFINDNVSLTGMSPILYKIEIPNSQREVFLRHLEAMNIHDSSLFPDIKGAAEYVNRSLEKEAADLLWKAQPSYIRRMLSNNSYHGDNDA